MMIGIKGYGVYIPRSRLSVDEIHRVWQNTNLKLLKHQLFVNERTVTAPHEDTIDLAIEAAKRAIARSGIQSTEIDGIYLGSCTNQRPFKNSTAEIASALNLSRNLFMADVQFSTKSGTSAFQIAFALVKSGRARNVLVIGSDTLNRFTAPGTLTEYMHACGAAAFIIGTEGLLAAVEDTVSYNSELTDAFLLHGERFIRANGFQSLISSLENDYGIRGHVVKAINFYLQKNSLQSQDFSYFVFQQPNGAIPFALAEILHFNLANVSPGIIVYELGDCGSASALISLAAILDIANPAEKILVVSYGFGAGSDAIGLLTTAEIKRNLDANGTVEKLIADKINIDYATAMVYEDKVMNKDSFINTDQRQE